GDNNPQRRIEARAIEMPSVSVRRADEIGVRELVAPPRRSIAVARQVLIGEKAIPRAELAKQSLRGRNQTLPHRGTRKRVHRHAHTGVRECDRGGRSRRTAADYECPRAARPTGPTTSPRSSGIDSASAASACRSSACAFSAFVGTSPGAYGGDSTYISR